MRSFTDEQREALVLLRQVWPNEPIVVIGAAALNHHFGADWRRTNDLDLTVTVPPERIVDDLEASGAFTRGRAEHVWFTEAGQKVDVLPAAPEQLAAGKILWSESGREMNLAGFDLALRHRHTIAIGDGIEVGIATVPTIVVLKVAAFLDRPAERDRDLEDLAMLFEQYLDEVDDRRFEPPLVELDFESHVPFALGLDVAAIAEVSHQVLVDRFLGRITDPDDAWATQLQRAAPRRLVPIETQMAAFGAGFERGRRA